MADNSFMVDFPSLLPAGLPADPALLPTLLELLPMGVIYYTPVVDAAGALTDLALAYLNPAAQRMTGLPAQPATTYRQQFPTTDENGAWDFHHRTWLSGEPQHFQFYYDADGFDSYFRVASQRLGEGLLAIFTDTQDEVRSQAEEALRQSQAREQEARLQAEAGRQRFYDVLQHLPALVAVYEGPELVYTFTNETYQRYFPAPAQLFGRPLREVLPEAEAQGVVAQLEQVYRTGEPHYVEELEVWLDFSGGGQRSQQVFLNLLFHPLRNAQGQVTGVLDYSYDVTGQVQARRQVEQLNQELEARVQARTRALQNLFAQAPMALAVLRGPRFLIEQANAQAEHIWGVAVADVLGHPHFEAVPGSGGQGFEEMLTGILATGEAVVLREVPIKLARAHTGQPSEGYYDVIFKPLFDEGQPQPSGIVVMWTETTDQVLARQQVQELNEELAVINEELTVTNEELNQSNTQLTRTNVDLDNFIYTASHDLKAPITNIEGLLLALEHELPPAARTGDVPLMLTMMQDATERFRRTINHLTDLSRLQKEHNPDANAVALAPVVEAVRLDLTPLLVQTQGQLTVSIPAGLTVTFAEKNLRSVVYNLLSNAFKYRHPDRRPEVQLRSWLSHSHVVLEVQDNGLGLDLAQGQERLFAMFQRLHTHVEGTGVGLYMVKRVLENAGGRIEVDSQLEQGSTFRVYFQR